MNRSLYGALLAALLVSGVALARQERRPDEPPRPAPRPNPLLQALDTDSDRALSAEEIAAAPVSLKKLDKDGDGKISQEELRPPVPAGGVEPSELVERLLESDRNRDGKLSKDELPGRLKSLFDRADTNRDGFLTRDELLRLVTPPPAPQKP